MLAATRLIALHKNKGKSVAACLKSRTDYAKNPDKTNRGELVSSYQCSPLTADEEFMLSKRQYEVKRGKYTAVKGKGQKRFIRFRTLGIGYGEDEIKAVLEGKAKHQPYQKQPPKEQPFQLLVDVQGQMAEGKSVGYKKWATKFNLKEMSKTLLFLQEQKIGSAEELRERAAATERYHAMGDSIKAAKTSFDEAGLQKLPKVKALDAEFAELLTRSTARHGTRCRNWFGHRKI